MAVSAVLKSARSILVKKSWLFDFPHPAPRDAVVQNEFAGFSTIKASYDSILSTKMKCTCGAADTPLESGATSPRKNQGAVSTATLWAYFSDVQASVK